MKPETLARKTALARERAEKIFIALRFIRDSLEADPKLERETLILRATEILGLPATSRATIRESLARERARNTPRRGESGRTKP